MLSKYFVMKDVLPTIESPSTIILNYLVAFVDPRLTMLELCEASEPSRDGLGCFIEKFLSLVAAEPVDT
jgi:hypothetical protein